MQGISGGNGQVEERSRALCTSPDRYVPTDRQQKDPSAVDILQGESLAIIPGVTPNARSKAARFIEPLKRGHSGIHVHSSGAGWWVFSAFPRRGDVRE